MERNHFPPDLAAAVRLGGEMGRCFASHDWASHPLGPVDSWAPSVRAIVATALTSKFPVVLWLGADLFIVYNDAYRVILGDRHPSVFACAGEAVWPEIWDVIGPMLQGVMTTGVATWADDLMLPLVTGDLPEERFFTFTYSPMIGSEGTVEGIFCAVNETTERVIGERRLLALNALGSVLLDVESVTDALMATAGVAGIHAADIPFLAIYFRSDDGPDAQTILRNSSVPTAALFEAHAPTFSIWSESTERCTDSIQVVTDLGTRLPEIAAYFENDCPRQAAVIGVEISNSLAVSLVLGLNPLRPFDELYQGFCRLFSDQLSGALASVQSFEHERSRAEALARLDETKTAFLTNVSHEFRTPLTLMLGPLEDAIAMSRTDHSDLLAPLDIAYRNGQRLLRMVNSLLDFARLEAGESKLELTEMDLGAETAHIASSFSELCRRADLELVIECASVSVEMDLDAWETVILNLLSNAFKFTMEGSICVTVEADESNATVRIADSGLGIDAAELDQVFDRFHRAKSAGGRSMEGSGIGLSLVKGLVEGHNGSIWIDSDPGAGTTISIQLPVAQTPIGTSPTRGDASPLHPNPYLLEAQQWIADDTVRDAGRSPSGPAHIVVADDNRDMRRHLSAVLGTHYTVTVARNGSEALDRIRRHRPDLVVTDLMMPVFDGLDLLAAIRSEPSLANLPVLLLSAKVGGEASREGFEAGADDYIAKPFKSSDLLDRVAARLEASKRERTQRQLGESYAIWQATLAELGSQLTSAASVQDVVDAAWRSTETCFTSGHLALGVVDRPSGLIRLSYSENVDPLLANRYHTVSLDAQIPGAEAIRSEQRVILCDRTQPDSRFSADAQLAHDVGSSIGIPLRAADRSILGVLNLFWSEPRDIRTEEIDQFEQVTTLVGSAIARLLETEREHALAVELQDRLLRYASSPVAMVSASYEAALNDGVGGDWYLVTPLDNPNQMGVSVGDVVGHGLEATMAMSQLRSALEVISTTTSDPRDVLDRLERFAGSVTGADFTTLAYVLVDQNRQTVTYACAGHPYPLLVEADGRVRFLEGGRRLPLRAQDQAPSERPETAVEAFPPGSLLLLYTDGLVERREESIEAGLERLAEQVGRLRNLPSGDVCGGLLCGLSPEAGFRDDVAIVVIRPNGSTATTFVDVIPAGFEAIAASRQRLRVWLEALGLDDQKVFDMLLGVGEAVNNAIEHGSLNDSSLQVTIEAFVNDDPDRISVTVSDRGNWTRDSAQSSRTPARGRGLALMHQTSDHITTVRTAAGTRVTLDYIGSASAP